MTESTEDKTAKTNPDAQRLNKGIVIWRNTTDFHGKYGFVGEYIAWKIERSHNDTVWFLKCNFDQNSSYRGVTDMDEAKLKAEDKTQEWLIELGLKAI